MGQARKETPRWRRKPAPSSQVVVLKGRQLKAYAAQQAAVQAASGTATAAAKPQQGILAKTGAYRFRRHLTPVWLLLGIAAIGLACHAARSGKAEGIGIVLGCLCAAALWKLTRHLKPFGRRSGTAMAALIAVWVPVLTLAGTAAPWPALLFASWLPLMWAWAKHYRWRPQEEPAPDVSDHEQWNLLAAKRKWRAQLGTAEALPGGGRRYPIQCDGINTVISNVLSASENVAGAWHKPMTEAYAERDPARITTRGFLTILGSDTLMRAREWNGAGIDPATGMAVIGRYADDSPLHMKFITPRYGTRHSLISGTTGAGKSELLQLIIFIALQSGLPIVPVILDPQEGQSLPFWRDRCLYAAGTDECLAMLAGLRAGMLDRSGYLAGLRWDDDGIPMRGMPFFDHALTGLPIPLVIFDEAHMLLADPGKLGEAAVRDAESIGRLGRKTGMQVVLATHIPSLADLGGSQALRDMLRGGGVTSLRTANRVAGGMLGLEKDPSEIPMFFADGKETYGLGYTAGPDNRPDAPMRTDVVPKSMKRSVPAVPALDDRFAEVMDRVISKRRIASVPAPASLGIAAASATASDDEGAQGRTAADAILAVLEGAGELDRGEIAQRAKALVTGEWGRSKPFSIRAIHNALTALMADGRITKPRGNAYILARPLHAVPAPS